MDRPSSPPKPRTSEPKPGGQPGGDKKKDDKDKKDEKDKGKGRR
jgi:hypothetical protein